MPLPPRGQQLRRGIRRIGMAFALLCVPFVGCNRILMVRVTSPRRICAGSWVILVEELRRRRRPVSLWRAASLSSFASLYVTLPIPREVHRLAAVHRRSGLFAIRVVIFSQDNSCAYRCRPLPEPLPAPAHYPAHGFPGGPWSNPEPSSKHKGLNRTLIAIRYEGLPFRSKELFMNASFSQLFGIRSPKMGLERRCCYSPA